MGERSCPIHGTLGIPESPVIILLDTGKEICLRCLAEMAEAFQEDRELWDEYLDRLEGASVPCDD